jgi:hypothetical protein
MGGEREVDFFFFFFLLEREASSVMVTRGHSAMVIGDVP